MDIGVLKEQQQAIPTAVQLDIEEEDKVCHQSRRHVVLVTQASTVTNQVSVWLFFHHVWLDISAPKGQKCQHLEMTMIVSLLENVVLVHLVITVKKALPMACTVRQGHIWNIQVQDQPQTASLFLLANSVLKLDLLSSLIRFLIPMEIARLGISAQEGVTPLLLLPTQSDISVMLDTTVWLAPLCNANVLLECTKTKLELLPAKTVPRANIVSLKESALRNHANLVTTVPKALRSLHPVLEELTHLTREISQWMTVYPVHSALIVRRQDLPQQIAGVIQVTSVSRDLHQPHLTLKITQRKTKSMDSVLRATTATKERECLSSVSAPSTIHLSVRLNVSTVLLAITAQAWLFTLWTKLTNVRQATYAVWVRQCPLPRISEQATNVPKNTSVNRVVEKSSIVQTESFNKTLVSQCATNV